VLTFLVVLVIMGLAALFLMPLFLLMALGLSLYIILFICTGGAL